VFPNVIKGIIPLSKMSTSQPPRVDKMIPYIAKRYSAGLLN
jgi:hypothetical protein